MSRRFYGIVRGMSMWPSLLPGELVRAVETDGSSLEPGEIVVLEDGGRPFIHRFVRYTRSRGSPRLLHSAGDYSGPDYARPVPRIVLAGVEVLRSGRWRRVPGNRAVLGMVPFRVAVLAARLLLRITK